VREVFMKALKVLSIAALVLLLLPALAAAQRMPREGGFSAFGGLGLSKPREGNFDADAGFSGGFEYFLTRNLSIGALGGGWKSDTDFGGDAKGAYVDFLATYNWEGGRIHPFVQGGVGAYFVDFPLSDTETEFGGFLGGGLDIFVARAAAVDLALRYHIVPDVDFGFERAEEWDANFFEAHAGVKFYF
jgi:opacity protein-like surface antigen